MRVFWSLVGIVVGVLLVWKTYPLVVIFGKIPWAERHLRAGLGGTYFFYKLIGLGLILISGMYMFRILDTIIAPLSGFLGAGFEGR